MCMSSSLCVCVVFCCGYCVCVCVCVVHACMACLTGGVRTHVFVCACLRLRACVRVCARVQKCAHDVI